MGLKEQMKVREGSQKEYQAFSIKNVTVDLFGGIKCFSKERRQ